MVGNICTFYAIKLGEITIACDGAEALNKEINEHAYYTYQPSQFERISATNKRVST